jgi:hypothetical protein
MVACAIGVAMSAAPSWAITVFERGRTEPTRGRLVRQAPDQIVIEEILPDGATRQRAIPRSQIEDLIDPVSAERLSNLAPDQPHGYRDYAEELAEKKVDPDARAAAIRLYLIAAHLDPANLAKSSLLGMTALARSPEEERKFRAMAYLHDPGHDRALLRTAEKVAATEPPSETRDALWRALQLRRQGNRRAALLNLGRVGVEDELAKYRDLLTVEEFTQVGLPDELLRKIVALELNLESGAARAADDRPAWSQLDSPSAQAPVPSLSLDTLTEFDPRLCVYRDGQWVAP